MKKANRKKGAGTLRKRGGKWTAQWTVNGKTFSRATGTGNRAKAERLLAEWVAPFQLKTEAETNRKKLIKIKKNAHVDGVACLLDAMCMRANKWEEMQALLPAWVSP